MRIAILIGVAEYQTLEPLPATSNDVEAIHRLLDATKLYSKILVHSGGCTAAEIREAIAPELEAFSGSEIEEAFFYFSGHGFEIDEQSFFATTDYNTEAPNKTSLPNSHVDDWLRSLRPKVAVKVIDCCESGVRYIKNARLARNGQALGRREFNDLYFLHSSHWTQDSYVDGQLSLFTRRFLQVIAESPDGPLKYSEIALSLTDAFLDESQKPQVTTSGNFT